MSEHPAALAISTVAFALMAQMADGPPAGIPGIVTTMTSTGVLVWYLWWTTTRTIPGIIERFEKQLESIRLGFERQIEAQRIHHRAEMSILRGLPDPLARGQPKKDTGDSEG
jgi:hypothetical protein